MEFVNQTVIGSKELAALSRGARKTLRRRRSRLVHTFGMAAALAVGAMLTSSLFRTFYPYLHRIRP